MSAGSVAIYLPSSMAAAVHFGFSVACGMVIFAGACETLIGRFVNRLRKLFPAVVSGVVIIAVGIELGKIGLGVLFQDATADDSRSGLMFATAFGVLLTMTVLAVWAKGLPRLLYALIGILVGYGMAAVWELFPANLSEKLLTNPLFAVPDPRFLSFGFEPSLMVPFAIAGLASALRVVGVLTTCQQMNDAAWRRPDMKNIEAGVMADGIGCAVGGALGAPGMSASPSLVSIEKTTGATSRVIAWSIASWLLLLACFPKFSSLIVGMPRPVMAAALFFNGSLMFVAGIQIVASRPITLSASLIIGFSILSALSVMIFPEFYESLPAWTHQFTGSEITMAVISSVVLNAIFLLGTWRYSQLRVGERGSPVTAKSFDNFFLEQASQWKLPPEDVKRVRLVVDEAIEQVSANAQGPVEIPVGSDSFDAKVALKYIGKSSQPPGCSPEGGNGGRTELRQWADRISFWTARGSHRAQCQRRRMRNQSPLSFVDDAAPVLTVRSIVAAGRYRDPFCDEEVWGAHASLPAISSVSLEMLCSAGRRTPHPRRVCSPEVAPLR